MTRRKKEAKPSHGPAPTKTIEIKVSLPPLPRRLPPASSVITLINRIPELNRRTLLIGSISLVALSAVLTANALMNGRQAGGSEALGAHPLDRLERGTPSFPTVLPKGKTAEQLGGWTRVSPPQGEAVYAYTDTIDRIPISVSQQPLPAELRQNTAAKVEEMAYSFSATEKMTVGRTTLYIGSSSNGPQSVILVKDDLLVLMKSTAPISSKKWGDYAASLR